jgi:hypothetical protein
MLGGQQPPDAASEVKMHDAALFMAGDRGGGASLVRCGSRAPPPAHAST